MWWGNFRTKPDSTVQEKKFYVKKIKKNFKKVWIFLKKFKILKTF